MVKCIQTALRIVNQLFRGKPTEYISNSGKGDKEVKGRFVRLEKTVRGLTVVVSADGVERRVCWRMSDHTADYVLRLTQGYAVQVPAGYRSLLCDDGSTTLGEFLGWCRLVNVITWEHSTGVIRLADGVNN
jgi:hypothetical protein